VQPRLVTVFVAELALPRKPTDTDPPAGNVLVHVTGSTETEAPLAL
jgi:hypothetical protein